MASEETRAVVGAGLMGHGIAQVLSLRPGVVWLYDVAQPALDRAVTRIGDGLAALVRHGLLEPAAAEAARARVRSTTDLGQAVESASFIVEAAPEDLTLKQSLFSELERLAPAEAVLATNTSSILIADIVADVRRGERVVGSHFFLPASIVPLVEVTRGPATSDATMDQTVAIWRSCGKVPIRVEKDVIGMIANRLQAGLIREAIYLVSQGVATPADVDTAVRMSFGLRYLVSGPLEQRDLGGLDLHAQTSREVWPNLGPTEIARAYLLEMVARGDTGVKGGRGFFDWSGQDPEEVRRSRNEALLHTVKALGLWPTIGNSKS